MASKSRRNKVKFKLTKELILLLVCLVAMITATVVMSIPSKAERALERYNTAITDYNTKNETQYGILDKDNVFDEVDIQKLSSKLDDSEYVYVFYGTLSSGDFLQNLTLINAKAKDNDIKKVYLSFATFIEEAEDPNSKEFITEVLNPLEAKLNVKPDKSAQDDIDLTDTKNPVLLVYKDGKLEFNSQTYKKNTEYSWTSIVNKAFTINPDTKAN